MSDAEEVFALLKQHGQFLNGSKGQTQQPASARVQLVPVAELKFEASSNYLLKGLINPGDLSVWFGPSGCGKTFAALHIARGIAAGEPVFERRVRKAKVALFALEGSAAFAKRIAAMKSSESEHPWEANFFAHTLPLALFSEKKLVDEVIEAIRACGAELVIFDTLSRTMNGANENAAEDMTHMVGLFDRIRSETGAHVMLIHHTGKDEERGGRGHSSLRGAVDTEVKFSEDLATRTKVATVTKSRDDADNWKFAFKLKPVSLGEDADREPITSCVVVETNVPTQTAKGKKPTPRIQKLMSLIAATADPDGRVRMDTLRDRAIAEGLWDTKGAVYRALEAAEDGKWIKTDGTFASVVEAPM